MTAVLPLVIALLATPAADRQDSVRVTATLTNDRIVAGESTILEVRVQTPGDDPEQIRVPRMPAGLDILGSHDITQTHISYPGGRTRITIRNVVLTGRVPGSFVIPPFDVVVEGRTYRTRTLPLVVLAGPTGVAPPGTASRVRLAARLEPARVYVGEQVTLHADAMFPRELRQRQTRPATYTAPNPPGFWAQDLSDPLVISMRVEDSEIVETQTFRRAYFPIQPGRHAFPPARLQYEFRPGPGLPPQQRELASDSLVLNVLPLPETDRPASFTGAVGRYTVEGSVEPDRAMVGEAVSLAVRISGTGNVKALPAPALPEFDDIEVFPPSENADVRNDTDGMSGEKSFTWVLVPRRPGTLVVPPIEYAWFDPDTESYVTASTDSVLLEVTGEATPEPQGPGLRPLRLAPSTNLFAVVRSPWFLAAQAVPLLILIGAGLASRRARSTAVRRTVPSARAALAPLREDARRQDREIFGRLASAMRDHAADLVGDPALRTATPATLRNTLETGGVPRATATALADLLDGLDRTRFAPHAPDTDAVAALNRAEKLLESVAAALARPARRATHVAILLLALPWQAAAPDAFDAGLQAWARRDYRAAAAAFERHLEDQPFDANAWYDAGNAWFLEGRIGPAILAWMRAVRLQPRHADARANLAAVAPQSVAWLPGAVALNGEEAAALLASLWWASALWTAARWRRQRRAAPGAAAAAAVAVLVFAAGFAGHRTDPAAVSMEGVTILRDDPALKAEEITTLAEGTPLAVLGRRPGWVHVRTAAGREGWVDEAAIVEL